jgi:hypothetical protein
MKVVEHLAVAAVRDTDSGNDLDFIRVQSSKFEILLSRGKVFNNTKINKICTYFSLNE